MPYLTLRPVVIAFLLSTLTAPAGADDARIESARSAWLNSARAGDAQAQYHLGLAYCCDSVENAREALRWHCRAAVQGVADAQYAMGKILANRLPEGSEATQAANPFTALQSAYMWLTVAASQGHDQSLAERTAIATTMSATDVVEAKRWATRWKQASCVDAGF